MQILFTFTKMYLAILKCGTVDIAAYGHILVISVPYIGNFISLVVSMSRSFVDWVIENTFMLERRMTILSRLIPRISTTTQIPTCMYFI